MSFERLFHPQGIAIIGASADITRIGSHPLKALKNAGYSGGIFPINPRYPELHGLQCFPDVMSIKSRCDLAVVAVPAPGVVQAIRDCGKAGIPFAVVLTAGFRETGPEGRELEAELARALAETGVRIVGPNCQGMISVEARVWAAFGSVSDETELKPGSVSCAFQSGGFGYAIVNLAEAQGVGFRYCVSSGNEVDITTPELLSAFLDDPGTSLAFAYLEGTPDARRLLDLGRKSLETRKPVMIWKAGTTDAGVKAAASHTANMTGSYDLYRAAMRQCGPHRGRRRRAHRRHRQAVCARARARRLDDRRAVDLRRLRRGVCRRRRARRPDAAALRPRDAGQDAPAGAGLRLAGEPGRHHGCRVLRCLAFHPHARGRAGGPGPRSAGDPARVDLRAARRPQRRGDRRRRRQDQETRTRRLVRPARQVREGRQGPGGRRRAVRHHARAVGACRSGARTLRCRSPAPAAAPGAQCAEAFSRDPARGRSHAQRGREQGGAAGLRCSCRQRGVCGCRR